MPIHRGHDSKGSFYQWGNKKKYYYTPNNKSSRTKAFNKARKQEKAIYSNGWKKGNINIKQNIKIAKELIELAKNLISIDNDDLNEI